MEQLDKLDHIYSTLFSNIYYAFLTSLKLEIYVIVYIGYSIYSTWLWLLF